ncbi:hypothetical protein NECAME_09888 [Necator americanus]|uniref:Uncharacterized protein n=1 Tax=Necator americanus TaxID=51031 RepID=W2TBE9_NECAM|nr:hypothetical protein NECAME_09888 [Necator americanus]ETN79355.1 hypothetical protein NECAME_09888 [Necator americanus]
MIRRQSYDITDFAIVKRQNATNREFFPQFKDLNCAQLQMQNRASEENYEEKRFFEEKKEKEGKT